MPDVSIHDACRRGDAEAVRALLAADPAAVDDDDEHGWRPIFHAALWRHEPVVRLLIAAGADLAAHDGYVMHYAGEVPDNKAVVALLVQYGALEAYVRAPDDLSRQLLAAVFLADAPRVRSLLARQPHLATMPDGRNDQPLHHAARNGDTEIVRLLIEHGADVNANGNVLYCAGAHGHVETALLLLDAGTDPAHVQPLLEWLAQYPEQPELGPVAAALERHVAGREGA
jgi:ankyrin repeat protein